jgi:hypothetical protein
MVAVCILVHFDLVVVLIFFMYKLFLINKLPVGGNPSCSVKKKLNSQADDFGSAKKAHGCLCFLVVPSNVAPLVGPNSSYIAWYACVVSNFKCEFLFSKIEGGNIRKNRRCHFDNYLSSSLRAGNVGMKSLDLGKGTSENHLCCNASSADMHCKRDELLRLMRKEV